MSLLSTLLDSIESEHFPNYCGIVMYYWGKITLIDVLHREGFEKSLIMSENLLSYVYDRYRVTSLVQFRPSDWNLNKGSIAQYAKEDPKKVLAISKSNDRVKIHKPTKIF